LSDGAPRNARPDVVIASNRLPVRLVEENGRFELEPSAGGLVSSLRGIAVRAWVGWPGAPVPEEHQPQVSARLAEDSLHPVFLSADDERDFYGRICNDTLWPLFHYFTDRLRITEEAWGKYVEVNMRFADEILAHAGPATRVWVHDFHLMLVPALLRARRPELAVGFFLHIPFPSSEIYRLLPAREQVLRGLLGADYVSFQSGEDARHFRSACLRVLGVESQPDVIEVEGRRVGIGADPIGIDVESFRETLADPATADALAELERQFRDRQLVIGVERLDYTKGIQHKLRAFERLLERDPDRARTTTMMQVLVPSRLDSEEYRTQRDEIELLIARINGQFGRPGMTPLEYMHRSISRAGLVAFYRRADVAMVTSLRDGMNLVAHEFALCQSEPGLPRRWNGVLLLSEFTGAAQVLPGAVLVNPWNVAETADRLREALDTDREERRRRLETMAARVEVLDSHRWAETFLGKLGVYSRRGRRRAVARPLDQRARDRIVQRAGRARQHTFLLDYDGTLRELATHPELAAPTTEILELLGELTELPATEVHVVSGRKRRTLDEWFGSLPVYLAAEHGYVARVPGLPWTTLADVDLAWLPRVERLFRQVAREVPGTFVERKSASVTWHYRQAEPEYAAWRAKELLVAIEQLLHGMPAEVLLGHRVVEVRARGVNKGIYVTRLFPEGRSSRHFVLAVGDDRTDQEMYAALPAGAFSVHVGGSGVTPGSLKRDQYLLESPGEARAFLRELAATIAARATV
jgi:trehalose 6-phosphate synthase/phosphatase